MSNTDNVYISPLTGDIYCADEQGTVWKTEDDGDTWSWFGEVDERRNALDKLRTQLTI